MKRLCVVLLALGFMSFTCAADTDVEFTGTVTDSTCDLTVQVNGVESNMVNLGVVPQNSFGSLFDPVYGGMYARFFQLVPDMSQPGCQSLSSEPVVTIRWSGGMDTQGLINLTGTASDAVAVFGGTGVRGDFITTGAPSSEHTGSEFADGAEFLVLLLGGNDTGPFETRSSFSIVYN